MSVDSCRQCGTGVERLQPHTPRLYCDQCRIVRARIRARAWALSHPDDVKARVYKQSEPSETRRKQQKLNSKIISVESGVAALTVNQARKINQRYGLSPREYAKIWDSQSGECFFKEAFSDKHTGKLDVDHNHRTGMVRSLLCRSCNNKVSSIEVKVHPIKRRKTNITDEKREIIKRYIESIGV